jgi:hypothetical protein
MTILEVTESGQWLVLNEELSEEDLMSLYASYWEVEDECGE